MAEKTKKVQIPFLFRFVRWFYPKLESFSPRMAEKFALFIFLRPLRIPEFPKAKDLFVRAELFRIEDDSVQCYKWGSAPYTLLVHGWSSRAMQLHPIITALLNKNKGVISFDAYGHGKSSGNTSSMLKIRDSINTLSEQFEIDGIVAHSLGGASTLLAEKEKSYKRKTIVIAAPVSAEMITQTFMDKIKAKRDILPAFNKFCEKEFGIPFTDFTLSIISENIEEFPFMIIHDEKDRESPISEAEMLYSIMPFAKFIRTQRLGHNRILKDEKVLEEILGFLDLN